MRLVLILSAVASQLLVAVGTPVAQRPPHRSRKQFFRTRLLPWMLSVEAQMGIWMKDFGQREPIELQIGP